MQLLAKVLKDITDERNNLLNQLSYENGLDFLLDAVMLFEKNYSGLEPSTQLQSAIEWFGDFIKDAFGCKAFKLPDLQEEELLQRLVLLLNELEKKEFNETLIQLFQVYAMQQNLKTFDEIQKSDPNCEVVEYDEGCIITRIKEGHLDGLRNYIRIGLQYEAMNDYYANLGLFVAFQKVNQGKIVLPGENGNNNEAAFTHEIVKNSIHPYLDHYGIEPNVTIKNQQYQTGLLVQLIAFFIQRTGSSRLPLEVYSWPIFIDRIHQIFNHFSREEVEKHLLFFTSSLDRINDYVNLFEKPLLVSGKTIVLIHLSLRLQNGFQPIIFPLIKHVNKGDEDRAKKERVKRSTDQLAQKFEAHGFLVHTDKDLFDPEKPGNKITDIDIVALKENWLVLLQIKMTHPRATMKEADDHEKVLQKAGKQMDRTLTYLSEHWENANIIPSCNLKWSEIHVLPLVISTSFEFDREHFSDFLKISQFELERYLYNDPYLMHQNPEELLKQEERHTFYPPDEPLTGELLNALVSSNALWSFLEPEVQAMPLEGYLPFVYLPNSKASAAFELYNHGNIAFQEGQSIEAEKCYRQAIDLFPHHETYYKGLGNAIAMQNRRKESIEYFDKAIEINPYFGEAYNVRGLTYLELGKFQEAYWDLQRAASFTPSDMSAWSHLVQLLLNLAHLYNSKHFFEQAHLTATKSLIIFAALTDEQQAFGSNQRDFLQQIASMKA